MGLLGGLSLYSESSLEQFAFESYQKQDYKNSFHLARKYLQNKLEISELDPIIEMYFQTESNLYRLDEYLDKLYFQSKNSQVYNLMYYLLEKSYQAKEEQIGEKWGEIFLTEGGSSSFYAKGLIAYSGILYLKGEKKKSKQVLRSSILAQSTGIVKKRFHLLKLALRKEEKIIHTASHFLEKNMRKPYADFVMALIIESYKKMGEEQKVKEWSQKLEKNFPNSIFLTQI